MRGFDILARNYRTPSGEIDLVALDRSDGEPWLVFVEVKTRTSQSCGFPEEAVSRQKWDRLQQAAGQYLADHPELEYPCRVDVIAIQRLAPPGGIDLKHFESVVIRDEDCGKTPDRDRWPHGSG